MLATGQLLGLIWKEGIVFPSCQFGRDPNQVATLVRPLIAAAVDLDYSGFGLTFWLYSPTTYFGGGPPVSYIGQPERLVEVFRTHAGSEW
ncbi:hypothetical protein [Cryobacterium ruanii]|uniref:DUF2384 domain-containing protein n=1 Tax=Cryobacterium ruanii TaxID=1259197 RepID=A0A4R9AQD1_9MICO|nr:hypothetical protein [Cryobacterium ruanii]TFD67993.1 hypothetical protein E3T47_05215 [Cryobacterium ruanii]